MIGRCRDPRQTDAVHHDEVQLVHQRALGREFTDISADQIICDRVAAGEVAGEQTDLSGILESDKETLGNNGNDNGRDEHDLLLLFILQTVESCIDKRNNEEHADIIFDIPCILRIVEHEDTADKDPDAVTAELVIILHRPVVHVEAIADDTANDVDDEDAENTEVILFAEGLVLHQVAGCNHEQRYTAVSCPAEEDRSLTEVLGNRLAVKSAVQEEVDTYNENTC